MNAKSPKPQLDEMINKFAPERAELICAILDRMRQRLPGAFQFVYDNYNFFVVGFGPTQRPSDAIFSIAADAHGVRLCFLKGAGLPDPNKLLRGSGKVVRNVFLEGAETLDRPEVKALIKAALTRSPKPIDASHPGQLIIRSVSAKQRPRQAAKK